MTFLNITTTTSASAIIDSDGDISDGSSECCHIRYKESVWRDVAEKQIYDDTDWQKRLTVYLVMVRSGGICEGIPDIYVIHELLGS